MTKHTPWTIDPIRYSDGVEIYGGDGAAIGELWGTNENIAANARLISAAPKLLEALEIAEQTLRNLAQGDLVGDSRLIAYQASDNARKAIAKAKL